MVSRVDLITTKVDFAGSSPPKCIHTRTRRAFLVQKNVSRKSRDREFAKFDENRRPLGVLNPLRVKLSPRTGGEKRRHR